MKVCDYTHKTGYRKHIMKLLFLDGLEFNPWNPCGGKRETTLQVVLRPARVPTTYTQINKCN